MTTSTSTGPLRARPHLHAAPVDDGVYLSGARETVVLRGWNGLFGVIDRCLPLLERGTSEDDLVAALGTEKARPVVRRLAEVLRGHGMLLDPADAAVSPSAADRARFGDTLTHLEAHSERPYAAFAALRAARVALVGPPAVLDAAGRALERAGVGEVVHGAADGADVTLACSGDLPRAATVVPVGLGLRAHTVGPVVRDGDARVAEALQRRVRVAAGVQGRPPVARPLGDALAGALAGHLVVELLAGLADETTAHVVHGAELAADRVTVARPGGSPARVTLDGTSDEPVPALRELLVAATALHTRWAGVFAPSDLEADLPALPVTVRAAQRWASPPGRVLAWDAGTQYSTAALALAVLREHDTEQDAVGAAGATERTWLLDGALRLLAPSARPAPHADDAGRDPDRRRLGDYLDALGGRAWSVRVLGVGDLPWRLARVTRTGTGVVLGAAWAPDAGAAVRDALSTAVARAQAGAHGERGTVALLGTEALLTADEADVRALRHAVTLHLARDGARLVGHRCSDPVLGDLPLHHGPVEIEPSGGRP